MLFLCGLVTLRMLELNDSIVMNVRLAWVQYASAVGVTLAVDVGVNILIFFPRHPQKGCGHDQIAEPTMRSDCTSCPHKKLLQNSQITHIDCFGMYCLDKFSLPDMYTYMESCFAATAKAVSPSGIQNKVRVRVQLSIIVYKCP